MNAKDRTYKTEFFFFVISETATAWKLHERKKRLSFRRKTDPHYCTARPRTRQHPWRIHGGEIQGTNNLIRCFQRMAPTFKWLHSYYRLLMCNRLTSNGLFSVGITETAYVCEPSTNIPPTTHTSSANVLSLAALQIVSREIQTNV